MDKYFTDSDLDSLVFFQVPKVLVLGDRYMKMKPNALKLYMVLFDRMKLSMQNGWKDEEGRYYVRMSQDGAAELFGWSPTTFRSMKKELESYGLLKQVQEGQGKANRLYILKCEYDEEDIYKVNKSVDTEMEENEKNAKIIDSIQKNNFCSSAENTEKDKSCPSRRTKVDLLEEQKLTSNNNNYSNNNFNKNKDIVNKNIVNKEPVNKNPVNKDDIINELILEYMKKGLNKSLCLKVVDEARSKVGIENFGAYLRSCLEKTLYRVKVKTGEIDPSEKMKEMYEKAGMFYFDWLRSDYPDGIDNDDDIPS